MKISQLFTALLLVCFAGIASADLEPWTDYDIGEGVSNVTTVKVDSNMIDKYLEGLKGSWVPANEILKEQGQIESYGIYVSQLPNGGDFNVILVVRFANSADMQPDKERYDAFMKAWGKENQEKSDKIVLTYPDIRTITGEYLFREITLK
ncbi:MAG: hypothetical protein GWP60_10880 [Gammaproteobacteria bacterium]|jgi:hypothetical protein|nr:hypothetical protein [Gammaproteobacteria bacterium]